MNNSRLTSRLLRAISRGSSGLTLIEVIIAVALLGVIAAGYMSALSTATMAVSLADQRTAAESLARTEMEYVKSQRDYLEAPWEYEIPHGSAPPWDESHTIPEDYDGYIVHVSAEPLHADGDDGIQVITVIVSHVTKEGVITLEGYKRRAIES